MTSFSVVFGLPKAFRTLLSSATGLTGVTVVTGPRDAGHGDVLAIQNPEAAGDYAAFGEREEDGRIIILVDVESTATNEAGIDAARDNADDLCGHVAAAIHADPTLGGLLMWAKVAEVAEQDNYLSTKGHGYTARLTVTFKARSAV
jgi:hypothetical protein